jgi:hypothetical protein
MGKAIQFYFWERHKITSVTDYKYQTTGFINSGSPTVNLKVYRVDKLETIQLETKKIFVFFVYFLQIVSW